MSESSKFPMRIFIGREIVVDDVNALQRVARSYESRTETWPGVVTEADAMAAMAGKQCNQVHEYSVSETDYRNEYSNIGTIIRTCEYQRSIKMQVWECSDGSSFECVAGVGRWQRTFCLP